MKVGDYKQSDFIINQIWMKMAYANLLSSTFGFRMGPPVGSHIPDHMIFLEFVSEWFFEMHLGFYFEFLWLMAIQIWTHFDFIKVFPIKIDMKFPNYASGNIDAINKETNKFCVKLFSQVKYS